ncbi:MAG: hypothetical protein AABZ77_07680, partial [Chloroflexota bacterium]
RKESLEGKVLTALLELHDEDMELSSQNIAERIAQSDADSEINSRKVGWIIKKLGLVKERVGKNRQRIIRWNQDRVRRLSLTYGLAVPLEKTPETSAMSAPDMEMADDVVQAVEERPPKRPPHSEADSGVTADDADIADNPGETKEMSSSAIEPAAAQKPDPVEDLLHMTREQALGIWVAEGKPIIYLGPGENCIDLERLLSSGAKNERHLATVREWLKKRQR